MSDRWIIAAALAATAGAWLAAPIPFVFVASVALASVALGRHWAIVLTIGLLASALSAHAWRELTRPVPKMLHGTATLLDDPELVEGSMRVHVTLQHRHYELYATRENTRQIRALQAGDYVDMSAVSRPLAGKRAPSLRRQHIAATVTIVSVHQVRPSSSRWRLPNGIRNLVQSGAHGMNKSDKALFTGLVYGDDRAQSKQSIQQFRDSGLAHLTAVSGENVALILAVMTPFFRRFDLLGRLICGLIVLILFGMVTRWQPSVVRAEVMAAVMLYATYVGRPVSLLRCTALGVVVSLLIDPFLVGSVGFDLSALACVGMALFGERLSHWFPGPTWLQRVLGYSAGAQLAVLPVELLVFHSISFVSLVTNALADPVAGVVMAYGFVVGIAAGLIGGPAATLMHVPTVLCLEWIRLVAGAGAWMDHLAGFRWFLLLGPVAAACALRIRRTATIEHRGGEHAAGVFGQG